MFDKVKQRLQELEQRSQAAAQVQQQNQAVIAQLRQMADSLPDANGTVTPPDFQRFLQVVASNNIPLRDYPEIRDPMLVGLAAGGHFIRRETTLLLKAGEAALWDEPAELLKEVADREWRGRSSGVSVPIGLGMRYRVGQSRGHMVTVGTHWTSADTGVLTITDQRVVYHGTRKTLEFPYKKLATVNVYSDALTLGVTTRQATSTLRMESPVLVGGLIQAAMQWTDRGIQFVTF